MSNSFCNFLVRALFSGNRQFTQRLAFVAAHRLPANAAKETFNLRVAIDAVGNAVNDFPLEFTNTLNAIAGNPARRTQAFGAYSCLTMRPINMAFAVFALARMKHYAALLK